MPNLIISKPPRPKPKLPGIQTTRAVVGAVRTTSPAAPQPAPAPDLTPLQKAKADLKALVSKLRSGTRWGIPQTPAQDALAEEIYHAETRVSVAEQDERDKEKADLAAPILAEQQRIENLAYDRTRQPWQGRRA